MRQVTVTYYKFSELPEDAQDRAIERLQDINVHDGWWDHIEREARNLGFEFRMFDIARCSIEIDLLDEPSDICKGILIDHGPDAATYKLASDYRYGTSLSGWHFDDDDRNDPAHKEFINALAQEYLSLLRDEYEYLTSREAVIKSIEVNEYEFTETGEIV